LIVSMSSLMVELKNALENQKGDNSLLTRENEIASQLKTQISELEKKKKMLPGI